MVNTSKDGEVCVGAAGGEFIIYCCDVVKQLIMHPRVLGIIVMSIPVLFPVRVRALFAASSSSLLCWI